MKGTCPFLFYYHVVFKLQKEANYYLKSKLQTAKETKDIKELTRLLVNTDIVCTDSKFDAK